VEVELAVSGDARHGRAQVQRDLCQVPQVLGCVRHHKHRLLACWREHQGLGGVEIEAQAAHFSSS